MIAATFLRPTMRPPWRSSWTAADRNLFKMRGMLTERLWRRFERCMVEKKCGRVVFGFPSPKVVLFPSYGYPGRGNAGFDLAKFCKTPVNLRPSQVIPIRPNDTHVMTMKDSKTSLHIAKWNRRIWYGEQVRMRRRAMKTERDGSIKRCHGTNSVTNWTIIVRFHVPCWNEPYWLSRAKRDIRKFLFPGFDDGRTRKENVRKILVHCICFFTDGECQYSLHSLLPTFSYLTRNWALKLVRSGSKLNEHMRRFQPGSTYHSLATSGLMNEYLVLDFTVPMPQKRRPVSFRATVTRVFSGLGDWTKPKNEAEEREVNISQLGMLENKKIIHVFVSIDWEARKQLEQLNRHRHDKQETTQLLHGASINNKRSHPITKTRSKKKK